MGKIIKVDLASDLFTYSIDEQALKLAELMDGKLLMVTNVQDLAPEEIIGRYKALADIERGFKVLKSELEIGPVYHRLPERIRAHASICFMALILHRVMRMRLRDANRGISPESALQALGMVCITPCGRWQRGLGRSAALLFLPIAGLLAAKRRLAPHPDPHYHRLARVMQTIPRADTVSQG